MWCTCPARRPRLAAPLVAVPGLGLSVDVSRRMLTFLQPATESYAVALRPSDR